MYTAKLGYKNGFAGAVPGLLLALAMLVVGLAGFVIRPLRDSGVLTIPELFDRRFGSKMRIMAAVVIVIGGLLNLGIFLRAGGEFLMIVTSVGVRHMQLAMSVLILIVLAYTVVGGMVPVLVADYLQFPMVGSGLVVDTLMVAGHCGWNGTVAAVKHHSRIGRLQSFSERGYGIELHRVAGSKRAGDRCDVADNDPARPFCQGQKAACKVHVDTSFCFVGRFLIPAFWGMGALEMLPPASVPHNSLQAMPTYLALLLPPGVVGLVLASMLAAEMSSDSDCMLNWGTSMLNDIIAPFRKQRFSAPAGTRLNRVILACIGAFLLFYGFWRHIPGRAWDYLSITASSSLSSISVLLVACCYWKRANKTWTVWAIIGGAVSPVLFLLPGLRRDVQIAGLTSFMATVTGMVLGSQFGPRAPEQGR